MVWVGSRTRQDKGIGQKSVSDRDRGRRVDRIWNFGITYRGPHGNFSWRETQGVATREGLESVDLTRFASSLVIKLLQRV